MEHNKILLVITGPTAAGKTAVGIEIAKRLGTEIISADSRQFYKEMSIGTAKPSASELAAVKHYFIDSHSIQDNFTVGDFEKQGLAVIEELFQKHNIVLLVGGSGLFVKAICEGFDDLPQAEPGVREKLNEEFKEKGITFLQEELKAADPEYYSQVDVQNPQRLIRALEVYKSTGKPFSAYRTSPVNRRPFKIVKAGLTLPREQLYDRINKRVDQMVQQGLVEEVRSLLPYRHLNALNTVGYSELFDYFDGKTDLNTAIDLIKQNTRRFAKRQLTWFRKDTSIQWYNPMDANIADEILFQLQ